MFLKACEKPVVDRLAVEGSRPPGAKVESGPQPGIPEVAGETARQDAGASPFPLLKGPEGPAVLKGGQAETAIVEILKRRESTLWNDHETEKIQRLASGGDKDGSSRRSVSSANGHRFREDRP
jgi:hypothetical protein